jgi:hypothetical protein
MEMKTPKIEKLEADIRELALNLAEARLALLRAKTERARRRLDGGNTAAKTIRKVAKLLAPPEKKGSRNE